MSMQFLQHMRVATCVAVLSVVGLTGCGGIEFESKLLDNVGLSPKALIGDGKHNDKKLETRAGIVVPPSTDVLPVPGSEGQQPTAVAAAPLDTSFPVDPETTAAQQKRVADAEKKVRCDPNNGAFGSRQSGQHSDMETPSTTVQHDCSTPAKDLLNE